MALVSVAGVASATQAISLANFTPRIENLPSSCSAAYTASIEGCQASDFDVANGARCSAQCVQGLIKIADLVTTQCANVDVPETSIIGVFMLGAGVPAVCPGVEVTTIGSSSTQAPTSQTTTQEASSTSELSSAEATDGASSASSTSDSETTTAVTTPAEQPTTATQPQITFDTSAAALPTTSPTTTASLQKSNQESGGGSPFDVQASSSSTLRLSLFASTAMLGVALFVAAVL
ncbi:hypothetical protein K458DRAFT_441548 [Lentithecium fluviatile CBS 122367]|uniref:Uncharacterized protein n=1 Tax=Lentithecium fluviatile CBS 122367 TaxID=1168545 RepID=A0A6G1J9N1_9PLEO|nr:hypothetical protein K458DRAFT_441548 [Lentithecium fluviatile CBS 122367]